MPDAPQSYANHVRYQPVFHYFLVPVMLLNFVWSAVKLFLAPGWDEAWWVVLSAGLVALTALVRVNPLRAQDRVIRLEEQLRYARLLPPDLAARAAASLTPGQIVALRFAPDAELPDLVRGVLEGRLSKPAEIKRAIKAWRADTFRV